MKQIVIAATIAGASLCAHAQVGGALCALTHSCPDQIAAARVQQLQAQQRIEEQEDERASVQRSIAADQAAYNSPQQQAMRTHSEEVLAEQRGPVECGGEKFRELWQASYSEKLDYEHDAQAADDPRYAANPGFQARERKAAAQEQAAYLRIKAQAMAACHG